MPFTVADARPGPTSPRDAPNAEIDFQTDVVNIPVRLCNLPPFNAIASQVLALTADPDVDLERMSRVIQGDPAFAADILFLANSSLFGFPSRMHSLNHAIALLGLDRVKALGVTVAMRGFLGTRTLSILQGWRHSAACALVCEEISSIFNVSGDQAYTAGILHDIGRLSLLKTYGKEMTAIFKGQYANTQEVLEAEREALHVDHGCVGAWLVDHWCLPRDFSEICEHHHDAPDAADSDVLQVVKAACGMADAIGFAAVKCRRQPAFEDAAAPLKPRLAGRAGPREEDLRAIVTARLAAFER